MQSLRSYDHELMLCPFIELDILALAIPGHTPH